MSRALILDPPFLEPWRQAPAIKWAGKLEAALSILFLFLYSQALIGPLFADPDNPEASVILRLIWLPVYAATLLLMLVRPGRSLNGVWHAMPIIALVGLAALSVMWSVEPETTVRRSFALVMTTLFGVWLAARWTWPKLLMILATTFGLLAMSSIFMAVAIPAIGVDNEIHIGAWRGVFWEKNTLGAMMAWATVSGYAAANVDQKRRWLWLGLALVATGLVLMSTSKTALLSCVLGTGGVIGVALSRQGFGFAALMLFLLVTGGTTLALVLLVAPVEALHLLGRDATLTGRTDIWVVLIEQVKEAPWTGFGYRAYWAADEGPVFWVRLATSWDVPTAHNGWIEIALALGFPGVALMALVYLSAVGRALSRLFRGPETYWALSFFGMLGLVSISESNFLQQNSLGWTLFVMTAVKLAERRAHSAAVP